MVTRVISEGIICLNYFECMKQLRHTKREKIVPSLNMHFFKICKFFQVFVWLTTFGGFFGVGVLRDFFRIPSYVKDINEDSQYVEELITKMRTHSKVGLKC